MNKENINLAILFIIVVMVCILIKRYYGLNQKEHFQNNNATPNVTIAPPDSTYNLQQYIETNPPIGSKVIKREISHTLPDVIDKDLVIQNEKQIRFGSMRGEAGSDSDSWHMEGISDASNPYLKMVLGDAQNKNSAFQIHGGACTVDSNCGADGRKLFNFDSQPNLEMYDRNGNSLLHVNDDGNMELKGNLITNSDVVAKKLKAKEGMGVQGNAMFAAQLNVKGKLEAEQDIHTTQNAKIDRLLHTNVINTSNANIRNRLYFSKAGNGNNWTESIDPSSGNFGSAHDSDVVYLEKRVENETPVSGITEGKLTTVVLRLSDDNADGLEIIGGPGGNNKLMRLDGNGNLFIRGHLHVGGGTHSNRGFSSGDRGYKPQHWDGLEKYVTKQTSGN